MTLAWILELWSAWELALSTLHQAVPRRWENLTAKLEHLLTEAEDCEIIGKLAADARKRELFKRLAIDLRGMAREIEALIALRRTQSP